MRILIADDSAEDRLLLSWALRKTGRPLELYEVEDGAEAIDFLGHQGRFADRLAYPQPELLLLDLKMPGKSGFDVLGWLGEHPLQPPLRTVVLSGSELPQDMRAAGELGAEQYLIKPATPEQLRELMNPTRNQAACG